MCKTTLLVILLSCLCVGVGISQSTELSFKIGNNGNLSLNSKFKSGNCAELNRFGKGHQGGIEIRHDFMKKFGVKVEASYLNANMEIDLESSWPIDGIQRSNKKAFYEEITVNNSSFNISASAVVNLGQIKIGVGPEVSYLVQSLGSAKRYYYSDSLTKIVSQPVQYQFFSKSKQVDNPSDLEETHTYKVNRIMYGLNTNISFPIYRSFSLELKAYFPMSNYIDDFLTFENKNINQTSINGQVSIVYSIPILIAKKPHSKRRKKIRPSSRKRVSGLRLQR